MYADDSCIAAFGNTPKEAETALNACLNHVAHWSSINRLIINLPNITLWLLELKQRLVKLKISMSK